MRNGVGGAFGEIRNITHSQTSRRPIRLPLWPRWCCETVVPDSLASGYPALRQKLGGALPQEPRNGRTAHGLKTAQKGAVGRVRELEAKLVEFKAESAALPQHVPVKDTGKLRHQMRLEQKTIIDRVKITAYNAEEWLLSILVRHYDNADDVRDLLRSFAALSGEMRRTPSGLLITLDPPDTPKHARALKGLCDDLNVLGVTYPGTEFPVIYNVAVHQKRAAA